jgi:hypothetical protein
MLLVNGWDEALATLRPGAAQAPAPAEATIGDFLTELKAKANLKAGTLEGYAKALRKIVSDVFELGDGNDKCDYWAGGYQAWLAKVHAVRLADLTPERVQRWNRAFLARAGDDPLKARTAKTSVNSFLRRARSLFAPKTVKHLTSARLPSPLPPKSSASDAPFTALLPIPVVKHLNASRDCWHRAIGILTHISEATIVRCGLL